MYDRSQWYMSLVQILKDRDQGSMLKGKYVLLLQVELGLRLLERLGLLDEPITVLWVLLSGLPIPDLRLQAFDQLQRHMIANARILLPFSGRFNWEHALREYAMLPQIWRCYNIRPDPADTQSLARELNRRTLDWCKDAQFKAWQEPELLGKALQLRSAASEYWRLAELRSYYSRLKHKDEKNDTT